MAIANALIFVLEDDPAQLETIRDILLRRPGFDVHAYAALKDLLADADLARGDLFIFDIHLGGGISGFEVPHHLPARCRFAAFLFISGYPVESSQYEFAAGLALFDFLSKPFYLQKFLHRVNLLLAARLKITDGVDDRLLAAWSREPFLSVVVDKTGIIRLCNQYLATLLGIARPSEIIGRAWSEFGGGEVITIPGEETEQCFTADIRALGDGIHRIMWFRSFFFDAGGNPMVLMIGSPAPPAGRKSDRLRLFYRKILAQDRSAIRSIKPLAEIPAAVCGNRGESA